MPVASPGRLMQLETKMICMSRRRFLKNRNPQRMLVSASARVEHTKEQNSQTGLVTGWSLTTGWIWCQLRLESFPWNKKCHSILIRKGDGRAPPPPPLCHPQDAKNKNTSFVSHSSTIISGGDTCFKETRTSLSPSTTSTAPREASSP